MNEIDWDKIPKGYDWAATDESGAVWVFKRKPKDGFCMWYDEDGTNEIRISDSVPGGYKGGSWRKSLMHRPSTACQEFPEHEVKDTYKAFVKYLEDVSKQMAEMQQELIQKAIEMVSLESVEKSILKSENRELRETLAELRKKVRGLIDE